MLRASVTSVFTVGFKIGSPSLVPFHRGHGQIPAEFFTFIALIGSSFWTDSGIASTVRRGNRGVGEGRGASCFAVHRRVEAPGAPGAPDRPPSRDTCRTYMYPHFLHTISKHH